MSKFDEHPLESVFGITPGSTKVGLNDNDLITTTEGELNAAQTAVAPSAEPIPEDDEDRDITRKVDEVYNVAMDAFQSQTAYTEIIEPRYAARNAEVAANYLKIALDAVAVKARTKEGKRRGQQFVPYQNGSKTTNNIVVADRNQILSMIAVDADYKEVK